MFFKRLVCIVVLFCIGAAASFSQERGEIVRQIRRAAESLTESYIDGRDRLFQENLAVLEFRDVSSNGNTRNIAQGVEDLFTASFSKSTVFDLIERRNIGTILEEQQLQLMGITQADSAVELGMLRNAEALLMGTINEVGDSYLVNVRLVNVETGEMVSENISLDRAEMIETKRRLDMEYISAMGVGISVLGYDLTMAGNNPSLDFNDFGTTVFGRPFGVEFKYRVTTWLMLGLGIEAAGGSIHHFPELSTNFQNISSETEWDDIENKQFILYSEGFGLLANLYIVRPINRRFNLFANAGIEYIILDIEGYFNDEMWIEGATTDYRGRGFGFDEFGPREWGVAPIFRFRGGFEWFMSPRAAFSLKAGWDIGTMEVNVLRQTHIPKLSEKENLNVNLGGFTVAPSISVYF